jgi:hypothetical protein
MAMSPTLHMRARALVDELNDFATATAALEWIFKDPQLDGDKLRVVELILFLQNRGARDEIDAVLADYDAIPEDRAPLSVGRDMLLLVMGKPALLFATSIYDEELADLVWRGLVRIQQTHPQFNLLLQAMDNTRDGHGLSSLHYAIEAQMESFFQTACSHLVALDGAAFRRAIVEIRSQDVVLPMAAKQITGKSITSGGCTLLHLAARKGELSMVRTLLDDPVAFPLQSAGGDWDGLSAQQLAVLHRQHDVSRLLAEVHPMETLSEESLAALQTQRDLCSTQRYADSMIAREPMTRGEIFSSVWSRHECEQVLRALSDVTERRGWSKQRHTSYPTTDLPCYQVASIDGWVRDAIRTRLFTQVYARYAIPTTHVLTFRELFYVKYEARAGEQAELPLHCDGSVLSFNILLNPRSEFSGGGTYFEEANTTIHIEQGEAVVHSGKVRHAGAAVTSGRRMILVGFLDLVEYVAL